MKVGLFLIIFSQASCLAMTVPQAMRFLRNPGTEDKRKKIVKSNYRGLQKVVVKGTLSGVEYDLLSEDEIKGGAVALTPKKGSGNIPTVQLQVTGQHAAALKLRGFKPYKKYDRVMDWQQAFADAYNNPVGVFLAYYLHGDFYDADLIELYFTNQGQSAVTQRIREAVPSTKAKSTPVDEIILGLLEWAEETDELISEGSIVHLSPQMQWNRLIHRVESGQAHAYDGMRLLHLVRGFGKFAGRLDLTANNSDGSAPHIGLLSIALHPRELGWTYDALIEALLTNDTYTQDQRNRSLSFAGQNHKHGAMEVLLKNGADPSFRPRRGKRVQSVRQMTEKRKQRGCARCTELLEEHIR